jgi:hypothetical protein
MQIVATSLVVEDSLRISEMWALAHLEKWSYKLT